MVEDVIEQSDQTIQLYSAAVPWQHIRQLGEDIAAGDMIVPSFTELTPAVLGAMLAAGVLEVEVIKKPLVGIIPTGNELVSPKTDPEEGDIIEFNSTILKGNAGGLGCEAVVYPIIPDDPERIRMVCGARSRNAISSCSMPVFRG